MRSVIDQLGQTAPALQALLSATESAGEATITMAQMPTDAELVFLRVLLGLKTGQKLKVVVSADAKFQGTDEQIKKARDAVKKINRALDHNGMAINAEGDRLTLIVVNARKTTTEVRNAFPGSATNVANLTINVELASSGVPGVHIKSEGGDLALNMLRFGIVSMASQQGMETVKAALIKQLTENVIDGKDREYVLNEVVLNGLVKDIYMAAMAQIATAVSA